MTKEIAKTAKPRKFAKQVRNLAKTVELKARCDATIKELFAECGDVRGKRGTQHAFRDNGANILAVAHCDVVSYVGKHFEKCDLTTEQLIFCPRLDDRLGVYTVLDLMPKMGINMDVLLTENEEVGASTASDFETTKEYNWIVEFDRNGTDVVTYNYDEMDAYLAGHFRSIGNGSFSDICELEHLGVAGVNVGVGYRHEHTNRCHMVVDDYLDQMARFAEFFEERKDTRIDHVPTVWAAAEYPSYHYGYRGSTTYTWPKAGSYPDTSGARPYGDGVETDSPPETKKYKQQKLEDFQDEFPDDEALDCDQCGEIFWEEHSISELASIWCPTCGYLHPRMVIEDRLAARLKAEQEQEMTERINETSITETDEIWGYRGGP